jgi:quercetin dioxygenase-like cupin family protein
MGSYVVREEEREFMGVEWGRTKNLFGRENVNAQYVRINITEYAPGTEHKPHVHPSQEEVIYVLEGEGISRSAAGDKRIGPGAFVFVPANTEHATLNILKDKPMKAIIIKSPPGERPGRGG